jgi:hypothetical protein
MINLGKDYISFDDVDADGWHEMCGGVVFHFKNGMSVFVSKEMAERISETFQHIKHSEDE